MHDMGYWAERGKRHDFASAAFTVGSSKKAVDKVAKEVMRRAGGALGAPALAPAVASALGAENERPQKSQPPAQPSQKQTGASSKAGARLPKKRGAVPRGVGGEWPSFAAAPVHALAVDRGCQVVVALAGSSCGRSIRLRSGSRHAARPTVLRCQLSSVQHGRGERVRFLQAGRPGGRARRAGWFGCARCRSTHVEGVQG